MKDNERKCKRLRRGRKCTVNNSNMKSQTVSHIKVFSTNSAGVKYGKINSLNAEVRNTNANIVTIQETHFSQKGKLHMDPSFVIFEAIRKKKFGGTMIAIHQDLNPKLIEEYSDDFELLIVEVETKDSAIRVMSGCGPQENWEEEKRILFFLQLEIEIEKAELAGKSILIQMDANSKLGSKHIKNDPHEMSPNGALLSKIIERHNLTVGNGSEKCEGLITRRRVTRKSIEESVIDFVIFSNDMNKHFIKMHIDEERHHVLKRIRKTKKGPKVKESDHNVLISEFNYKVNRKEKEEKIESYNMKNKECQTKFKKFTTHTKMLSSTVDNSDNIDKITERLIKKINGCIKSNFKRRRIRVHKKVDNDDKLYEKMRDLRNKEDDKSKCELANVIEALAEKSEENFNKIKESMKNIKSEEGAINEKEIWKLKKKLCPKSRDPHCAMLDSKGNLLTSDEAIRRRALEVYSKRLEPNEIEPNLKDLERDTNTLCEIRLKLTKTKKTDPWSIEDLKFALKQLANDKSRDPEGFPNELFKEEVAGDDLLVAVLKLMNKIKESQKYPQILEKCNITSIYKKKSRNDFSNYRGVFRVQVLRSILDRLTYNDSYYTIDSNLTDGNVGARKQRGVRDNIFVMSAINNSVINGKSKPIQVQIMDIDTCFDKLWLQSCINAIYEAGLNNDKLNLLYIENRNAQIAVKINNKLSARISVKDVILQGSIWGSLKCTSTMDTLNKIALADPTLVYNYQEDPNIPIGVLGMVDDTATISECGNKAIAKNAVVNSFVESQRLTLSKEKSSVVHIGNVKKCRQQCPDLKIHKSCMKKSESTKYLGNFISSKGGICETIEDRRNKGWGKIATIMGILEEVTWGKHRMEVGLMLRKSILLSSMLFSAESWSGISEKHLKRLEVVDTALLRKLGGGHSKCAVEFHHLESGTLKIRHILSYLRIMYHHHILSRDENETIKKVYNKQKENFTKGDWYQLLKKDFEFIGIEINEDDIRLTPKNAYKKKIKQLVQKAAFNYFMNLKSKHSKLNNLSYKNLQIQPYLTSSRINNEESQLLYNLRSNCYNAKWNFKKMHKNDLLCVLGCSNTEDQIHIFMECKKTRNELKSLPVCDYYGIFGEIDQQIDAIKIFIEIDKLRNVMKKHISPGGPIGGQDPARCDTRI